MAEISCYTHLIHQSLEIMDENTLVYLDFPKKMPTENPFLIQGWIISHAEIQAIWLAASENVPLTLVERPDVRSVHTTFPFVKGFHAVVNKTVLHKNTLNLHYRLNHGEFEQIITLGKTNNPTPQHLIHRKKGYQYLKGNGLEIGALHQPAALPKHCTVVYCDVCSREEAILNFPELNLGDLVHVDYISDLDNQGLNLFSAEQFDFVIFNHVIEHIANPIKIISELFRILKLQGYLVISAPDKRFTYDKNRALTPFFHLLEEYQNNITEITEEHYLDFLRGLYPHLFAPGGEQIQEIKRQLKQVKNRREHAHVWDSSTFSEFMSQSLYLLKIKADCVFKHLGDKNKFEYFSVWQKH